MGRKKIGKKENKKVCRRRNKKLRKEMKESTKVSKK